MIGQKCRECGCTDITACLHDDGSPCAWMDDDLCTVCADRLQAELERDAARYRHLRNRQTRPADIAVGGVFAGRVPNNIILGGEDLDRTIDAEMGFDVPQIETLEKRLADCLAACIDTPLLQLFDPDGRAQMVEVRMSSLNRQIANRAAGLLEEAGR